MIYQTHNVIVKLYIIPTYYINLLVLNIDMLSTRTKISSVKPEVQTG